MRGVVRKRKSRVVDISSAWSLLQTPVLLRVRSSSHGVLRRLLDIGLSPEGVEHLVHAGLESRRLCESRAHERRRAAVINGACFAVEIWSHKSLKGRDTRTVVSFRLRTFRRQFRVKWLLLVLVTFSLQVLEREVVLRISRRPVISHGVGIRRH